jgi:hypothetical protein
MLPGAASQSHVEWGGHSLVRRGGACTARVRAVRANMMGGGSLRE